MGCHGDGYTALQAKRFCFLIVFCFLTLMCPPLAKQYSRAELLVINRDVHRLSSEISIPPEIRRLASESSASTGRQRRRCERKQKRGKRAGVRARLKANPSKPPLPSIFLANVRSIRNKLDEIRLRLTAQRTLTRCCCMIFTETWLDSTTPDAAIQLAGRTVYRADRTADSAVQRRSRQPSRG